MVASPILEAVPLVPISSPGRHIRSNCSKFLLVRGRAGIHGSENNDGCAPFESERSHTGLTAGSYANAAAEVGPLVIPPTRGVTNQYPRFG